MEASNTNQGPGQGDGTAAQDMDAQASWAAELDRLRDLITKAKAMPMSASCVVNRADALALINRIGASLPEELATARGLINGSKSEMAKAESEANKIIESAREHAAELARHSSVMRQAEEMAAKTRSEAQTEVAELRMETDAFIDERMATFESVLHKTSSQVKTARHRLAQRSNLDAFEE